MKIKMHTTKCGPVITENWNEGQVLDMSAEEVRAHVKAGRGINLEPFETATLKPPETAVTGAPEKAVLSAPEFAGQVAGPVAAKSPAVAPPAAPVKAGNLTQPPTWGKGVVK